MLPALNRVEEACEALQQAAANLKHDPKSTAGKRNLIIGERGILQGVSTILLRFDESEVRKITQVCKQVLEYLSITELIERNNQFRKWCFVEKPLCFWMTGFFNAQGFLTAMRQVKTYINNININFCLIIFIKFEGNNS